MEKKLLKSTFIKSLKDVATSFTNGDHGGLDYLDSGVRYLRGQSITEYGLDLEKDPLYISLEDHQRMERAEVIPGDVVLTIAGSIGNSCVIKGVERANINQAIVKIRPSDEIDSDYLAMFLNSHLGKFQTERLANGAVQLNVNFSETGDIKIIVPSLETQHALVAEMESARAMRQSKLAEAESLLTGIDGFVLDELGLKLPKEEKRAAFAIRQNELDKRLDTHFYKPFLRKTEEIVLSFKPEVKPLESLLEMPPLNGVDAREYLESGQKYLRVQNVHPFEIFLDDVKYVDVESAKNVSLKSGDILLTRKGTFGVAAVVTDEFTDCLISSEVILLRLRKDSNCSPDYVATWLNSKIGQALLDRHKSGGIMGHITQDVVNLFPIPIPPNKVQEKIVAELQRRRAQARQLREEAESSWQEAKAKFEKALLG